MVPAPWCCSKNILAQVHNFLLLQFGHHHDHTQCEQQDRRDRQFDLAKKLLNAFLNELDSQKGKSINQQAYALLKADTLYLLSNSP
jgi:hypothetical protein